jgi:hypothetical protein
MFREVSMKVTPSARRTTLALAALLVIAGAWSARPLAQSHTYAAGSRAAAAPRNPLVDTVRQATERFRDVDVADAAGYKLMFGCVSGPDYGAMGLHYVNMPLVLDGELDPSRPEIVIYEPQPNGRLRLVGADYLVFKAAWEARNTDTPKLMGQLMHLFESPNRYGLDPFYTLHVWAWKENPNGAFTNWHPKVSCHAYPSVE